MKLIYTEGERAGHEVKVLDKVVTQRGDDAAIDWQVWETPEPHKPDSEGKVYLRQHGMNMSASFYASIIGARWIGRTDRHAMPVYSIEVNGNSWWFFDSVDVLCQALRLLARNVTPIRYAVRELDAAGVSQDDVIFNDVHIFRAWLGLPPDREPTPEPTADDERSRSRLEALQGFIQLQGDGWKPNMVPSAGEDGEDGARLFVRSGGEVNVYSSPDGLTTDLEREFGESLLNGSPTIRLQVADVRGDSALVDLNWHEATRIAEAILKLTSIKANG